MPWPEHLQPTRMARVALAAPVESLRDMLARVADEGVVELEVAEAEQGSAARRLQRESRGPVEAMIARDPPDLDELVHEGRLGVLAGEAQLEERMAGAIVQGPVAAVAGWAPQAACPALAARLAEVGGAVVPLPHPRGAEAPTLLLGRETMVPLVETYGTVPYEDLDPTPLAWAAYVLMFGMMFGDAGHGLMLLALAVALRAGRPGMLRRFRRAWTFVAGAAVTSIAFGLLYGEFFGPTGVVPVLWLDPLDHPIELMAAALGVGAVLLAGAYVLGTVNRWREGGWSLALYEPSGIAGSAAFLGLGAIAGGLYLGAPALTALGAVVGLAGLVLAFTGFLVAAGVSGTGVVEAVVELFDLVLRLGTNLVSFARLAAFGLTHAALASVVWSGTEGLAGRGGPAGLAAAAVVFCVGTALTFALEALVAGVQALRLEYYELFSRLFREQGRPFRPWHLPLEGTGDPEPPARPDPSQGSAQNTTQDDLTQEVDSSCPQS